MSVPVRWPGKTFFYPVGNTPAVNLTQSLPPEGDANILLLGCGDPRNVLYTLFGESKRDRRLDFTCCDVEPAVLARNVILLTLVMDGHPLDTIWNVFYHYNLDDLSLSLLVEQCKILLSVSSDLHAWRGSSYYPYIQFSTSHTLILLRRHWELYVNFPKLPEFKHKALRARIRKMLDEIPLTGRYFSPALAAGMAAPDAMILTDENLSVYRRSGVIHPVASIQEAAKHINPTFVYSILGDTCAFHYATYPLQGFHIGEAFSLTSSVMQKEMVDCVISQFKRWCTAWKDSLSKTVVRFAAGEAIVFCRTLWDRSLSGSESASLYVSPWVGTSLVLDGGDMPTSFDVIDTSNLMDFVGALNILTVTAPLLSPSPSSTLQTEALIGVGKDPVQGFVKRLCADIPTFASLLGIAPIGYLAGFHTESNIHEIMLSRTLSDMSGPAGQKGFHERIAWKLLPPVFPSIDSTTFAKLMTNIYRKIFGAYEDMSMMANFRRTQDSGMASGVVNYHRHSFIIFLSFLKGRFHMVDEDWDKAMDELLLSLQLDRSLIFGTNFYQEICGLMYVHGVHTISLYKQPKKGTGIFKEWGYTVPPVVCVVLVFPKTVPGIQKLLDMHPSELGSVMLEMGIRNSDVHNLFSAIQITYGKAKAIGEGPNKRVEVEEDEGGWASSAPDASIIISAWVPSFVLQAIDIHSTKVALHIHQSLGTMAQRLIEKFGVFMVVHEENLLNASAVHVLVSRPGQPRELDILQASAPKSPPAAPRMVALKLDAECKSLKDMTIRETIVDEELATLQGGAKVEVVHTTGLCNAMAEFGGYSKLFTFPLPVDSVSARLRIARKSGYIELVSPPIAPGASRQVVYVTLAPVLGIHHPINWNMHCVNLTNCPTFKQGKKRSVEIAQVQCSLAMSDRERAIRERGINTGLVGAPENLAVLNVKDTLHSLISKTVELEGTKHRMISLSDEKRGGIYATILVNRLCLDLSSHTVTLDCNVVIFERKTVLDVAPLLHNTRDRSDIAQIKIGTSGDETLAWLHLLPAFVERCRTWAHLPECDYRALRRVPVSSIYGEMPLCRCGLGQDLGHFFDEAQMDELKPHAVRAAISPLYAVSYLDIVGNISTDKTSQPKASNPNGCAKCGTIATEDKPLRLCSKCKKAKYCGAECQKSDWDTHKHFCKAISK